MSININGSTSAYSMYQQMQKSSQATGGSSAADTRQTVRTNASDTYFGQLSQKYDCVKNGKVSISPAYLRACADDPAKAKELEENLDCYNECYESGLKAAQQSGEVLAYDQTWSFDKDGNLAIEGSITVRAESGGKSMKELLEELEEEAEKKAEQEKLQGKTDIQEQIKKTLTENNESSNTELKVSVDIQYVEEGASLHSPNTTSIDVNA